MVKVGDIVRLIEKDWISGCSPLFKVVMVDSAAITLEWLDDNMRKELKRMYYKDIMTMTENYPQYVDISVDIPKQVTFVLWCEDDFEIIKNGGDGG